MYNCAYVIIQLNTYIRIQNFVHDTVTVILFNHSDALLHMYVCITIAMHQLVLWENVALCFEVFG